VSRPVLPAAAAAILRVRRDANVRFSAIADVAGARGTSAGHGLDFCPFGKSQGIFDINTKIAHSAFDLRVTEQDLNGTQVAGLFVNQRCLRPAEGVRSVVLSP
jgi:hypothetical protein